MNTTSTRPSDLWGRLFRQSKQGRAERLGSVCMLLAAGLMLVTVVNPDHFPPWTSFHAEAPAFGAAALLLLACCASRTSHIGRPTAVILVLVTTVWLQWAVGLLQYAGDAWVVTAYLVTFASAWFWAATHDRGSNQPQPLELVMAVIMVLGLLTALQAIMQWLQLQHHLGGWVHSSASVRSTGNLGQPNQAGTLLLMAIAAAGSLVARQRIGLAVGWTWFLVGGWAVVLTQSRTALLSATLMVVAFVALTMVRPTLRAYRWHAIAWLGALFAGGWLLQSMQWDWTRPAVGADVMTSVGLRPIMWRQLVAAVGDSPWFGYGWLQVSTAQQAGSVYVPGVEQVNYSHNILIDAFVMLGIPFTLLLLGLILVWASGRLKRLREDDGTAVTALFMLAPFCVHSMLELPHAYAYFLVPVGILIGVVASRTRDPDESALAVPRALLATVAASFIALLGALLVEYAAVEEDYRVNRFENRKLGRTPDEYVVPNLRLLTQFESLLQAMRLRATRGMTSADLDTLVSAARRYTWAPLEFRAALALALNGRPHEARWHLEIIKAMFPSEIYEEGRSQWLLQQEKYPELMAVPPP